MKKSLYILLLTPFMFFCSTEHKEESCVKPKKEKSVMYTPSELALLMKNMYEVNTAWKEEIEKGNVPTQYPESHRDILTAKSSNKQASSDFYRTMALTYLNNVEGVIEADSTNVKAKFNGMINTCVACHEQICQGPISRIKKLYIK